MKRFRTKLLLLFIGLLLGKNMNAQVSASLDEFSIKPGETKEVNVYLTNGDIDITDFEGYIALPKGFSFVAAYDNNSYAKMTGRETAGQALTAEIQTDGRLLFGIYQMTGTTGFSGKEGSVVAFTIKADENINLGNYTLKMDDGLAVTIEAVSYDTPCSSTITVYKLFDVNVSSNNTTWGNVTGGGKELMPNTSVTLTATPVEGYKFVNWTFGETELSKENPYTFNVNDDTNIVGNFAINQYTMTFVPGNGEENIVKTQDYGTELTAPDNLKREGYTFNGWDSEVPQTVPASDKTFTAQWTSTVYTITYTLDGGKTETENPTSYTIESKEITLNNPAKEGYTFMGWTGTGLKQATSEVTIPQGSTGNRSYTATWKVIEVNPIEDEAVVDFSTLSDETLQNNVVNDVYYNLDGSAYDSTDESIVIGQSTDMQQINDKSPGSNDICSKFKGLIIKVGTGNGSITVNTMTSGNAALAIQIGNNTPTIAQKTDKGDVTVGYEATEDTYVYIYSTISNNTNSIKNLSIASTEDFVKIYNITVIPGTTGINIIRGFDNADIETIYDLNGRKLHAAPTKGGIYIINGKKVVQ